MSQATGRRVEELGQDVKTVNWQSLSIPQSSHG